MFVFGFICTKNKSKNAEMIELMFLKDFNTGEKNEKIYS